MQDTDELYRILAGIPYFEYYIKPDSKKEWTDDNNQPAIQYHWIFLNGHGSSVIRRPHSHGYNEGLWEMCVLNKNGELDYSTPITNDVLGNLTDKEVYEYLLKIKNL